MATDKARLVRAITQPAGMNIDWARVRAGSAAIAGLALLHGLRQRRWRYVHTLGVIVGVAAAGATVLQNKGTQASRRSAVKS